MVAGTWFNQDGLYLKFGTQKAVPNPGAEYLAYGANRIVEVLVDLTKLTSTAAIQSDQLFFPSGVNVYIESVEAVAETAAATGTSFSVGLIQADRATIPSNYSTAFINAEITAAMTPAGKKVTYVNGTAQAGGLIGSSPAAATGPYYITALSAGSTYTTGLIRVRINYHGIGVITQ